MCTKCRIWICFSSEAGARGDINGADCLPVWEQALWEFGLMVPQHCLGSVGLAVNSVAVQLKVALSQMAPPITGVLVSHMSSSGSTFL